jgi:hypothetical protein
MAISEKERCARDLMGSLDQLRTVYQNFKTTNTAYFENGFNIGGADEITDADLLNLNLTSADLINAVTLLQNYENLMEGIAVTVTPFKTVLSRLKWWSK